ncbi:hypothetical protein H744_1c1086 [Photobacterium gaetbulicola Gung47]|uniref:Uncharacterized protein n=2 Tax=Photobacterium gaetbulicola TaxID=1295392 RepID=A0A0C5W3R3_9GAMM|nr:hypothetical protein [Photobacterium gaetbulicola]AJR06111.1 hypothetical protein H744_1c1086 [Photobacterium gaetbulicola Gung47]
MKLQFRAESKQSAKAVKSWKKSLAVGVMAMAVMSVGLTVPSVAEAKGHKHGHHHKHHKHKHYKHKHHKHHVVVVKPRPPKKKVVVVHKPPRHRYYHRSRLPEIATFAVIAGATYAIIDNHYYKRRGDNYEYVDKPR